MSFYFYCISVQEVMVFFAKKIAEKTAAGVRQSVVEERKKNIKLYLLVECFYRYWKYWSRLL